MNKIYNAFDNIKVDDKLKEETYKKIIENNKLNSSRKINFFHLSLAMTSIIICIFIYSINGSKDSNLDDEPKVNTFNAVDTSLEENDYIIYNNIKYILDSSIVIDENMLEEKIGNANRESNMESSIQNNVSIYSIKNIDKELQIAIVNDQEILVFKVEK
ncbi:MAG: hypothetical protein ACM3O4_04290 [Ignavibacteriales bacterium]